MEMQIKNGYTKRDIENELNTFYKKIAKNYPELKYIGRSRKELEEYGIVSIMF